MRKSVATIEDILARCEVDPITDCWLWGGAKNRGGIPRMFVGALGYSSTIGAAFSLIRLGERAPHGMVWHRGCRTSGCANIEHFSLLPRRESVRRHQKGRAKSPEHAARIRLARSTGSDIKISDAHVQRIRAEGMTLKAIAAEFGVRESYASEVRSGKKRK